MVLSSVFSQISLLLVINGTHIKIHSGQGKLYETVREACLGSWGPMRPYRLLHVLVMNREGRGGEAWLALEPLRPDEQPIGLNCSLVCL